MTEILTTFTLGFLLAYLLREREISHLRQQNGELLGSIYHRVGYRPEPPRKKSEPLPEQPDELPDEVPDLKDRMEQAVAKSNEQYGDISPEAWMKLSPDEQARRLRQINKGIYQEMKDG